MISFVDMLFAALSNLGRLIWGRSGLMGMEVRCKVELAHNACPCRSVHLAGVPDQAMRAYEERNACFT